MATGTISAVIPKSSIVDNVTTNDSTKVLSAKQGKSLNDLITGINTNLADFTLLNKRITANGSIEISYAECIRGILVTFGGSVSNRMGMWTIYNVSGNTGYVKEIASASQLTVTAGTGKITVTSTASAAIESYILVLDK